MSKKIIFTASVFFILLAVFSSCTTSDIYKGPSLTSLASYELPKGYMEWQTTAPADNPNIITGISFAKEDATEPNLFFKLIECDGIKTGSIEYKDFFEEIEKEYYSFTLDVDGERYTGYVIESTYIDDNDKTQKYMQCLFQADKSIFSIDYFAPEGDTKYKPFFQLIDSIHIITAKDIPQSLDSLITINLPKSYVDDMVFTYDNKEGGVIVERCWADRKSGGYFTACIFSYKGRDCNSSPGAMINVKEYINGLSDLQTIKIDGEKAYFGTMQSEDISNMSNVVYVENGDYVFQFRITNSDEQVTKGQTEMFLNAIKSVKFQ